MINGCATYRAGVALPDTDTPVAAMRTVNEGHGRLAWISLSDPSGEECARLAGVVGLNGAAAAALERSNTRASFTTTPEARVVTAGVARYDPDRDLVDIGGITLVMAGDVLLTVTRHAAAEVRDLRGSLERTGTELAQGPGGILRAHIDTIISGYGGVLRDLRADVEALEREVFGGGVGAGTTQRIYRLKREAVDFQQASAALIDPVEDLMDEQDAVFAVVPTAEWAALRDRLVRLVDRADSLSDLLTGILTAYQTDVALQQNEDMRKISAWVAIAAVPTLLAGVYGMNFDNMPELNYRYGYYVLLGIMISASVGLYLAFRSRHWL